MFKFDTSKYRGRLISGGSDIKFVFDTGASFTTVIDRDFKTFLEWGGNAKRAPISFGVRGYFAPKIKADLWAVYNSSVVGGLNLGTVFIGVIDTEGKGVGGHLNLFGSEIIAASNCYIDKGTIVMDSFSRELYLKNVRNVLDAYRRLDSSGFEISVDQLLTEFDIVPVNNSGGALSRFVNMSGLY